MAGNDGLKMEIIEGIEVYRIDYFTGGYDEVDVVDEYAVRRRKASGWWGDQSNNYSDRLSADDLKATLARMSSCLEEDLDCPGVYMYVNKVYTQNFKKYIGSAIEQTILQRQQQHLCSASHAGGQVGKFDAALSTYFNAAQWDFFALPLAPSVQLANPSLILAKERELILKFCSNISQFGYNTQLPGGQ